MRSHRLQLLQAQHRRAGPGPSVLQHSERSIGLQPTELMKTAININISLV